MAGNGPDSTFHSDTLTGGCGGKHPFCGEEEGGGAILDAIDRGNYSFVAMKLETHPTAAFLNKERQMLQLLDCRGKVSGQVRVDLPRLVASIDQLRHRNARPHGNPRP